MKKILLVLSLVLFVSCDSSDDEHIECIDTNGNGIIDSDDKCYNA